MIVHNDFYCAFIIIEHVNITELNAMVPNPIYEGAAIYEEIPGDVSNFRSLSHTSTENNKPASAAEKEEGYLSMSNSIASNWDFPTPKKCYQVSTKIVQTTC